MRNIGCYRTVRSFVTKRNYNVDGKISELNTYGYFKHREIQLILPVSDWSCTCVCIHDKFGTNVIWNKKHYLLVFHCTHCVVHYYLIQLSFVIIPDTLLQPACPISGWGVINYLKQTSKRWWTKDTRQKTLPYVGQFHTFWGLAKIPHLSSVFVNFEAVFTVWVLIFGKN